MPEIAVRWIGNPCQNGSTHGAGGGASQRCKTSAGVSHNRPSAFLFSSLLAPVLYRLKV